jgi:hypothetical protein
VRAGLAVPADQGRRVRAGALVPVPLQLRTAATQYRRRLAWQTRIAGGELLFRLAHGTLAFALPAGLTSRAVPALIQLELYPPLLSVPATGTGA